jgi:hypothetical protein
MRTRSRGSADLPHFNSGLSAPPRARLSNPLPTSHLHYARWILHYMHTFRAQGIFSTRSDAIPAIHHRHSPNNAPRGNLSNTVTSYNVTAHLNWSQQDLNSLQPASCIRSPRVELTSCWNWKPNLTTVTFSLFAYNPPECPVEESSDQNVRSCTF